MTSPSLRDRRISRVVYGVFIALATSFVVSSTTQVARAIFGTAPESPRVSGGCKDAVRGFIAAVDRIRGAAVDPAAAPDDAQRRFGQELEAARARLADPTTACAADVDGAPTLAALARYERAAETTLVRGAVELGPVRRELDSFIR